jgi:hypothetical protein
MRKLTPGAVASGRRREVTWEDPGVGAALARQMYAHATTTCLVVDTRQMPANGPAGEGNGDGR